MKHKHRDLTSVTFMGERVDFIASNDRLQERVENVSKETYLIEEMVKRMRPDDIVWDIGACLGIHTFITAKHLIDGRVIGFEPMPRNQGVLVDNMTVNGFNNVEVRQEALSNKDGTIDFAIRESIEAGYGRHSIDIGDYDKIKSITVPTVKGDSIIGEVPQPNIVKIDVEGAGPLVLEGMKEQLKRDSCRNVFFETHEPNPLQPSHEDFGYTVEDIITLFEDCGFTVRQMENDYHLHAIKEVETNTRTADFDIEVVQGDIAEQSADALISSAGTSLRMGSGVAGSLREKGEGLEYLAIDHIPAELGTAVTTKAPGLQAEYVIHAVNMPHYGDGKATIDSMKSAVRSALEEAEQHNCESIVIPAVGCGLAGLPLSTGVEEIFNVLSDFNTDTIDEVYFIAYSDNEYETVNQLS